MTTPNPSSRPKRDGMKRITPIILPPNENIVQLSLRDKYFGVWVTIFPIFENMGYGRLIAARWEKT